MPPQSSQNAQITKVHASLARELPYAKDGLGNGCLKGLGRALLDVQIVLSLGGIIRKGDDRLPKLRKLCD